MKNKACKYNCSIILPPHYMFSDNAAMIGWVAINKFSNKFCSDIHAKPNPRLTIN